MAAAPTERLREEDPGTQRFLEALPLKVEALDSRFEYDLNRPPVKAIPLTPESAWGITVWKRPLKAEEIRLTMAKYCEFHELMDILAAFLTGQAEKAFLFDLHSYCYQRNGKTDWRKDNKPVINLGTKPIGETSFRNSIDALLSLLRSIRLEGEAVSVAENEVFTGGYLARRLSSAYPGRLAVFAIEFKKIFMDEHSGEFFTSRYEALLEQFSAALNSFMERAKI